MSKVSLETIRAALAALKAAGVRVHHVELGYLAWERLRPELAFAKCYEAAIAFLEVSRRIDEADPDAAIAMLDAKQFSRARELLEEAVRKATTSTKC